eukprot:5449231-Prymnesium_polylepis.1
MGRWRCYWSQGRKWAEGRRQRGSLARLGIEEGVATLLRDACEVGAPWRGVPVLGLWAARVNG